MRRTSSEAAESPQAVAESPESSPPDPSEKMLLPCSIEFGGVIYGPGEIEIISSAQRRALERAIENSGYGLGEPIEHDPENPQVFSGEAQTGKAQ
jgi:hypothetical protein